MKTSGFSQALVVVLAFVALGALLSLIFSGLIDLRSGPSIQTSLSKTTQGDAPASVARAASAYNPPKPEEAPASIREAVLLGANILADTPKYAGSYVGNTLRCTNCHFNGGVSQGGKNGGVSLVGVAAVYPKYRERQHAAVDLVIRTNDCFQRSMNGKALPPDSKEMIALITYYQWIARGLPIYGEVTWLGVKPIQAGGAGDRSKGQAVYAQKCGACHGPGGQGTPAGPALWGKDSYNDGAGMAKAETLAAFAFLNMPRGNPVLSEADAVDVAAYVDGQPRPRFADK
jgi:thiosulfate dehydrogenase